MKIRSQLTLSFGAVIALLMVIALVCNLEINSLVTSVDTIERQRAPQVATVVKLQNQTMADAITLHNLLKIPDPDRAAQIVGQIKAMDEAAGSFPENLSTTTDDVQRQRILATVVAAHEEWLTEREALLATIATGQPVQSRLDLLPLISSHRKYSDAVDVLVDYERNRLTEAGTSLRHSAYRAQALINGLAVMAILMGLGVAVVVSRGIARPLSSATDVVRQIAAGDLSSSQLNVNSTDEVGELMWALNAMTTSLGTVDGRLRPGVRGPVRLQQREAVHVATPTRAHGQPAVAVRPSTVPIVKKRLLPPQVLQRKPHTVLGVASTVSTLNSAPTTPNVFAQTSDTLSPALTYGLAQVAQRPLSPPVDPASHLPFEYHAQRSEEKRAISQSEIRC